MTNWLNQTSWDEQHRGNRVNCENDATNYSILFFGVVFTGNMLQTNPIDVTQNQNIAQNFNLQQQPTTQAFNRVVLESQAQNNFNNFINGRVQVGESKATVELNALSVGQ